MRREPARGLRADPVVGVERLQFQLRRRGAAAQQEGRHAAVKWRQALRWWPHRCQAVQHKGVPGAGAHRLPLWRLAGLGCLRQVWGRARALPAHHAAPPARWQALRALRSRGGWRVPAAVPREAVLRLGRLGRMGRVHIKVRGGQTHAPALPWPHSGSISAACSSEGDGRHVLGVAAADPEPSSRPQAGARVGIHRRFPQLCHRSRGSPCRLVRQAPCRPGHPPEPGSDELGHGVRGDRPGLAGGQRGRATGRGRVGTPSVTWAQGPFLP
mmetsp:Transcript_68494/g.189548  ORF Transcript_68494/g.189548 Transcript_68494/m.189548 type:complete len:270 (-) Transcript_68494:58-867(-)